MREQNDGCDNDVVERVRRGDSTAIRALFDAHFESLVDYAASFLRSTEAAEDLVADIFSSIVSNPEKFAPSKSVRAYLLWMVRNRALDVMRGQMREQQRYSTMAARGDEAVLPSLLPSPDEAISGSNDDVERILRALDSLAPIPRSIVVLRLRQGLEYSEIAQIVGLSEPAVRMQLSRALKVLRERL